MPKTNYATIPRLYGKKILISLLVSVFLLGCNRKNEVNTRILDLVQARQSTTGIKLSDFAESISYIPLETLDSVILSGKIRTAVSSDHILAYDRQAGHAPVLFDRSGHFAARIGHLGHGPGEWLKNDFLYMNHISFNENRKAISFESSDKQYEYSYDGSISTKPPIPKSYFSYRPIYTEILSLYSE